jgi:uncharacterized protein YfaS (alpha-2-macroglobulin family)
MAEKTVTVKKPLMLLATLPRVLGPAEELKIPVTVFATESSVKDVSINLQSNPFIEAIGTQKINFVNSGEQTIYFTAKVKNNTGIGKIKVTATSGKEQAAYETEIDIRNANPLITQVSEATLQPGQSYNAAIAMLGDVKSSKATVEISSMPAINLQKRLDYLIFYPHGCIEQTTSTVFPQLVLNDLTDLSDERKREVDMNVKTGIAKIQNFQQSDGGFSYWPEYESSNEWCTNYAGHFLLEATAKGYSVPAYLLQQWKGFEKKRPVTSCGCNASALTLLTTAAFRTTT